jgi:iron(III) transport system permease protein
VQSVDEEMLRAARGLGATSTYTARTILAPLLRVTLVGLCALAFSLCAGELSVTVLVQAPGGDTLPLPVFSLLHAGLSSDVAVLSLLQCVLSGGAMVVATFVLSRRSS